MPTHYILQYIFHTVTESCQTGFALLSKEWPGSGCYSLTVSASNFPPTFHVVCLIPVRLTVTQEWSLPLHKLQLIPRCPVTLVHEPSVSVVCAGTTAVLGLLSRIKLFSFWKTTVYTPRLKLICQLSTQLTYFLYSVSTSDSLIFSVLL